MSLSSLSNDSFLHFIPHSPDSSILQIISPTPNLIPLPLTGQRSRGRIEASVPVGFVEGSERGSELQSL